MFIIFTYNRFLFIVKLFNANTKLLVIHYLRNTCIWSIFISNISFFESLKSNFYFIIIRLQIKLFI